MGQFGRYRNPPIADGLMNVAGMVEQSLAGGPEEEYYDTGGDPFMGGLPPPDFYGQPRQQWNAEMMDRLIDTSITERDRDGNPILEKKPKLWLFDTKAFRHFQLTNLRSRDQTELERDIADILMLSHQDGNDDLCEEMQQRVYAKISMFKSRSDLPIQHRERDAWFTNVSEMKTHDIPRPRGNSGNGFFDDLIGKKRRSGY